MSDLREQLRAVVPPQASFATQQVNDRADGLIRRRRALGVAAVVVVAVVAIGVVQQLQPIPRVMLDSPDDTPALGVFALPPMSAEEREALSLPGVMELPEGTRLARQVEGYRYLVSPSSTGGFCLHVVQELEAGAGSTERCAAPPGQSGLLLGPEGRLGWLVPDGYDHAVLNDGRQADVINNVSSIPALTIDPDPDFATFTGPAGELVWESGMVPFPEFTQPFPDGISSGLDAPGADLLESARPLWGDNVRSLYEPDLTQAGVALIEGDVQVWVVPRADAEGVCLLVMEAKQLTALDCAPSEQATRWPFLASVATTDGRWAALVADGWDTLRLPGGQTIEESGNVLWLDVEGEVPETAILIGSDRQTPVALRLPVEHARSESGKPLADQRVKYSVFDKPAVPDHPRLTAFAEDMTPGPGADPSFTPALETARLAYESDDLTVFVSRARAGDAICLISTDLNPLSVECEPLPHNLQNPLSIYGYSRGAGQKLQMIETIPDGYDTYVLDDDSQVPVQNNVLVVEGLSPSALSGELRGPAGSARIDLGAPGGPPAPSQQVVQQLADVCPTDLPAAPTAPPEDPGGNPTLTVPTPPPSLSILEPDGTGMAGQYEPSDVWTAYTNIGDPLLLGDGPTLGQSDNRVIITPLAAPLAAHCLTMHLTAAQHGGDVVQIDTPSGPVTAVAVDDSSPFLVWIDLATGTQLQLFAEGDADIELLKDVAATLEVGP